VLALDVRELRVPDDVNEILDEKQKAISRRSFKKYAGVNAEESFMAAILIPEFISLSFLSEIPRIRYRFIETERLFASVARIDNIC